MNAIDEFVRLQEAARKSKPGSAGHSLYASDLMYSPIGRIAQDLAERLERIRAIIEITETDPISHEQAILDLTDTAKPLGETREAYRAEKRLQAEVARLTAELAEAKYIIECHKTLDDSVDEQWDKTIAERDEARRELAEAKEEIKRLKELVAEWEGTV